MGLRLCGSFLLSRGFCRSRLRGVFLRRQILRPVQVAAAAELRQNILQGKLRYFVVILSVFHGTSLLDAPGPYTVRCRTASYSRMAAAADAFREEILPRMGMLTRKSQFSAIGADDNGRRALEIGVIEPGRSLGGSAEHPDALLFQILQQGRDIGHPCHRHIADGSGGGLGHNGRQTGAAALGDDDPVGSGALGGAEDGPQIVGVGDLVAHHQQGLLAIGTICGGPEDIITPESGFLIRPGDVDALAAKMKTLYDTYESFDKEKIRQSIVSRFDFQLAGQKLRQVYSEALEMSKPPKASES